jgi:hypothetical protein
MLDVKVDRGDPADLYQQVAGEILDELFRIIEDVS